MKVVYVGSSCLTIYLLNIIVVSNEYNGMKIIYNSVGYYKDFVWRSTKKLYENVRRHDICCETMNKIEMQIET